LWAILEDGSNAASDEVTGRDEWKSTLTATATNNDSHLIPAYKSAFRCLMIPTVVNAKRHTKLFLVRKPVKRPSRFSSHYRVDTESEPPTPDPIPLSGSPIASSDCEELTTRDRRADQSTSQGESRRMFKTSHANPMAEYTAEPLYCHPIGSFKFGSLCQFFSSP
jgi:hypothetical protein